MADKKTKEIILGGNAMTAIASSKEALEIGDRMRDGTVVIAVDLKNNRATFAPESIFGGNSASGLKYAVVKQANHKSLHGHDDWRKITGKEASSLAKNWDKVAPPELQGSAAPHFWGRENLFLSFVHLISPVYSGSDPNNKDSYAHITSVLPVPVVRSGPAWR